MISSEARISANRRNALKSTGPKTAEGKERSRLNGIKHGLCSTVVMPDEVALFEVRTSAYFNSLKPQNEFQCWMVDEVAVISIGIDRCERQERRCREKAALRADLCWEDDRRLEAILWGEQLAFAPEKMVEKLRSTPQGCEWMMGRWAMLARVADLKFTWSPDQTKLAMDLLGMPREFRENLPMQDSLDFDGKVISQAEGQAGIARREIAALKERLEEVDDLDTVNRVLAAGDLSDDDSAELKRIRRYESTLHRRLRWCVAQVRNDGPEDRFIKEYLRPRLVAPQDSRTTPKPEPMTDDEIAAANHPPNSIHPPFDINDDEIPESGEIDIQAILKSRREKKQAKAEARIDAKRREVERMRA